MTTTNPPLVDSLVACEAMSGSAAWNAVTSQIRRGEAGADEFTKLYSRGLRILYELRLGRIGLDTLIRETISGVIAQIRSGGMRTTLDYAQFVQSIIRREQQRTAEGASKQVLAQANMIAKRLRAASPLEQRILARRYLERVGIPEIAREFGVSEAFVLEARQRLCASQRRKIAAAGFSSDARNVPEVA